ncbi:sigma 54-interacting transcriptional regulator [Desulfobacterales bacterium HSG16]|nr:sigma 54-interacting transcriptional regulator [Desulfobacterales bacterium HSG16]
MSDFYYTLLKSFLKETDMEKLRLRFLVSLIEIQNVERGSIWIKENDHYLCVEAVGKESSIVKSFRLGPDKRSIVGWVIENKERTIADPRHDKRSNHEIEDQLNIKNTMILCFPLLHENGEIYGALEILDTSSEPDMTKTDQDHLNKIQDIVDIGSLALSNAIRYNRQKEKIEDMQRTIDGIREEKGLVDQSPTLQDIMEIVRNYAALEQPVLITGEDGTEKEFIARQVHNQSARKDKLFHVVNCNIIPHFLLHNELFGNQKKDVEEPGVFEKMNGGTVFLNEIDSLPLDAQAGIVKLIEHGSVRRAGGKRSKKIDVRIIAGTAKDLEELVDQKGFERKLFQRLSILTIDIPPLHKRGEHICSMINYFLWKGTLLTDTPEKKVSAEAMELLNSHTWPGNTKEVKTFSNRLLNVSTRGEYITSEDILEYFKEMDFPDSHPHSAPSTPKKLDGIRFGDYSWEKLEKEYVLYILKKNRGNISKAAKDAAIKRSTFVSRMKRLDISRFEYDQDEC